MQQNTKKQTTAASVHIMTAYKLYWLLTNQRWKICFTPLPLYLGYRTLAQPLDRRLVNPHRSRFSFVSPHELFEQRFLTNGNTTSFVTLHTFLPKRIH